MCVWLSGQGQGRRVLNEFFMLSVPASDSMAGEKVIRYRVGRLASSGQAMLG